MGNDFFKKHKVLGSAFDFNRNGDVDFGEAMSMGGVFGAFADEMARADKQAERDASKSSWDNNEEL